ncbi:uncharacterized protein LAESUDRAFT_756867 [Laetiporus sulphureus 93-53]|uniref:Uncharacterized protein n=1 Tax=Laetiporus sulphureus 93-53 TaxID=1314785 RepID=A0A165FNB5_9APHY|nr:uncharacterized protein LAESUDRAFT_756867 [Laetiporus sulphureus 93-53]KZT09225.1 hypothetical protein LAESUDRAFT_756867 [Laetiporus sulphureus 93-53]
MATAGPQQVQPQAGPLPPKRGEIGYREDVHGATQDLGEGRSNAESSSPLPARHPADTPLPPIPSHSTSAGPGPAAPTNPPASGGDVNPNATSNSTPHSVPKHCKRVPTVAGLRVSTLAVFIFEILVLAGTITGWAVLIQRMQSSQSTSTSSMNKQNSQGGQGGLAMGSALIFVYVAFAIMTLVQIIILERTVFRLRAERYAHMHPGEILPTSQRRAPAHTGMALVPWNRPSLPTYAAALAQSGVSTGDVEDNIIAVPPPPAYGDTRASTLLLAGARPERLRAQRLRESAGSVMSWTHIRRASRESEASRATGDRPKSYMSTDPEWEERMDAQRAVRLEETLAKLEEGDVTDATGGWRASRLRWDMPDAYVDSVPSHFREELEAGILEARGRYMCRRTRRAAELDDQREAPNAVHGEGNYQRLGSDFVPPKSAAFPPTCRPHAAHNTRLSDHVK